MRQPFTAMAERPVESRGLRAFRDYLAVYLATDEFSRLAADTATCKRDLGKITYLVRVKGMRVEVSRYDGEPDYSAEIEATFERFRQGAVKDYQVRYRGWPGMNHVGAQPSTSSAAAMPVSSTRLSPSSSGKSSSTWPTWTTPGRCALLGSGSACQSWPPARRRSSAATHLIWRSPPGWSAAANPLSPTTSNCAIPSASSSSPAPTRAARPRSRGPSASCTT
jgi:hypothetical protein